MSATNKTAAVRQALTQARRPLSLDELRARLERRLKQIVSKAKLYTLLSVMCNSRELDSVGRGENRFYWFR